ncbi:MAG: LuxR C-terminal-related transcriptional regulator [Mycobacterium sp.]
MAITVGQFSQLVVGVYEAALTPSSWPTALDNIGHAVQATGCGLVVAGPDSRTPQCATLPDEAIESYRAHYHDVDYVLADVESGPVGVVRSGPEVIDPMADAEFDADWMRPNDVRDGVFVRLTDKWPTSFLVAAPRRSDPFATAERLQVVTALVPHLQQALRAQNQIAAAAQWADDLCRVINTSTDGMIIVDSEGRVLYVNTAAEAILTDGDGITVHHNRLHARHPVTNAALARCITSAAAPEEGAVPRGDTLRCPRRSGTRAYLLHILPLNGERKGLAPGRVLIAVIDTDRESRPDTALLQRLYGLTCAEANVAVELLAGQGLPAVADKMFLSVTTVRTHLQRVYDKTDTHRQAELVRLLVSLRFGSSGP